VPPLPKPASPVVANLIRHAELYAILNPRPVALRHAATIVECALTHIRREEADARSQRSGGKPDQRGDTKMTKLFHSSEAAEIFALEHRFPVATVLMCILMAGSVGSAVLTLVAA
jgi:hypothetical protein